MNPLKKQIEADMAPPSDEERRSADRFKNGLIILAVAGAASFGGYMMAPREELEEEPVAAPEVPIADYLRGTPSEEASGASWAQLKLARGGDADAQFEVAQWYLSNRPEEPTGMRWMMAAARNGHPEAVGWMAHLYADGENRSVDRIRSAAWAMIAAEIGAELPDRRRVMAYLAGLTDADRAKADHVASIYRVEVRANYQRRVALERRAGR